MRLKNLVTVTIANHAVSVKIREGINMIDKLPYNCGCGHPTWSPVLKCDDCWRAAMDAQAKLERMRYERTHFSDGTPVEQIAQFAQFAPEESVL